MLRRPCEGRDRGGPSRGDVGADLRDKGGPARGETKADLRAQEEKAIHNPQEEGLSRIEAYKPISVLYTFML
jgi:hypothetical protein